MINIVWLWFLFAKQVAVDTRAFRKTADFPHGGFTLIEVLIVVVIMAVIAGTLLSRMPSALEDSRESVLEFNLKVMQGQIELYRAQHRGAVPVFADDTLPQLLSPTNEDGETGEEGPAHPFGPYIQGGALPINPLTGSNTVRKVDKLLVQLIGWDGGWLYHEPTGRITANRPGNIIVEVVATPP